MIFRFRLTSLLSISRDKPETIFWQEDCTSHAWRALASQIAGRSVPLCRTVVLRASREESHILLPSQSLLRKINRVLAVGMGLSAAFDRIEKPWPTLPEQVFSVIWEFLLAGGITYLLFSTMMSPKGIEKHSRCSMDLFVWLSIFVVGRMVSVTETRFEARLLFLQRS